LRSPPAHSRSCGSAASPDIVDAISIRSALEQSGLVPVDARVLLAHVLARDRAWLIAHGTDALSREDADAFFKLAKRRRDGEPVAYLTGRREFWGLDVAVTPDVLIPRPETESLVEAALARLPSNRPLRVLDLGTGSGAIALAIASERPQAKVLATDKSQAALEVAHANAQRLRLSNVSFANADWYEGVLAQPFELIACNPPYVAEGDAHLGEGDLRFEPPVALTIGGDGLAALRIVVGGAAARLAEGGSLVVEHGHDQSESVQQLFAVHGFKDIQPLRDMAGIRRIVAGKRQ
jgi:release factor glutamine methyltransferase